MFRVLDVAIVGHLGILPMAKTDDCFGLLLMQMSEDLEEKKQYIFLFCFVSMVHGRSVMCSFLSIFSLQVRTGV